MRCTHAVENYARTMPKGSLYEILVPLAQPSAIAEYPGQFEYIGLSWLVPTELMLKTVGILVYDN